MQKCIWVFRFLLVVTCLTASLCSVSQNFYDEEICLDKTPKELQKEWNKKQLMLGLKKALVYISYLNYSDRTNDRVFTGADEFQPYSGKIIRNIEIKTLQPFGVSIERPTTDHYTRFQKFANKIQFKTHEWAIRNELLFKQGEHIVPIQFADTERNLWQRGTFKDLKIFITPVEGSEELVDVIIVAQDRWSWSISTSAQYNKAVIGVEFDNLMGMPQSISQKISINYRKDNPYTVYGGYEYDNIKRSHIDISAEYQYENLSKGGEIAITRDFFSANTLWAGHVKAEVYREAASVPNALDKAIPTNIFYHKEDVWLATSFKIPGTKTDANDLRRIILSGRMYRYTYMNRPFQKSNDGTQLFFNHSYFLGSVGLANWNYYVDHSVFSLGNAEYFSKGFNMAFVAGLDDDEEMQKRFYSGVEANYGGYIKNFGYVNTKVSYSGFLHKKSYEQLLFKWTNRFFSAPINLGRQMFMRQFITTHINLGFNRAADREIAMNNLNGVRGIFVNYIRGQRSYVFNFETNFYPRFKVLGFSSALFLFADIAVMQQNSISDQQLYQGYGAGIRLRNLSLGINFFEFSFVYYPTFIVPGSKPYTLIATTDRKKGIPQENLFLPTVLTPEF